MRYWEIIEATITGQSAQASEKARRAREQLAATAKKRAEAARDYQDQLARAHESERKAKAELGRSRTGECVRDAAVDAALCEGAVRYLRDRNGVLLGTLNPVGRILQAKDRHGSIAGWYDPRTDLTRDRAGNIVGSGDLLAALLFTRH